MGKIAVRLEEFNDEEFLQTLGNSPGGKMLTVHLHLCNGDVITIPMTRSQRDRLGRTLNQAVLPVTPFEATVDGADLSIPWRSIAYLSSPAQPHAELLSGQAAD